MLIPKEGSEIEGAKVVSQEAVEEKSPAKPAEPEASKVPKAPTKAVGTRTRQSSKRTCCLPLNLALERKKEEQPKATTTNLSEACKTNDYLYYVAIKKLQRVDSSSRHNIFFANPKKLKDQGLRNQLSMK